MRRHLERGPAIQNAALRLFLSAIERNLHQCSPGAGTASRLGAVVFIHSFGALLNAHLYFHCVVVDGVFDANADGGAVFHLEAGLDEQTIAMVKEAIRQRFLQVMARAACWSTKTPSPWPPGNTATASR